MKKFLSVLPNLFKKTYEEWKEDKASRLAAALAYHTIFSFAPMLVIVIAVAGLIWQRDAVQAAVMDQVRGLIGTEGAIFVADLLQSASNPAQGVVATVIGIITLLLGAIGVFNELHDALNTVWDVQEEKANGILDSLKRVVLDRFLSFTMVLGIGFMLLVSLVVSTGITATETWMASILPLHELILQAANLVISIGVITVFFALIYKVLPDAEIAWRDVWMGAFVTAVLFSIGKTLIGLYLGSSAIATSFGAAGSLVLLLVWIYYSAQILFFGAEFTQVYANQFGSRIVAEGQPREKELAHPQPATMQSSSKRITIPVTVPNYYVKSRTEQQVQRIVRVVFGLMTASFLAGIATMFVGFKGKTH